MKYIKIPIQVELANELCPMAKILFGFIFTTCDGKPDFFTATNSEIAERYNCTVGQVSKWISQLRIAGFIDTVQIHQINTRLIKPTI
jgi:hypothetical protein